MVGQVSINYLYAAARVIPEVECKSGVMFGQPCFTNSRLPLYTIILHVYEGVDDAEILGGYPRMTPFLLNFIRQFVADCPPPPYKRSVLGEMGQ